MYILIGGGFVGEKTLGNSSFKQTQLGFSFSGRP